jgi:hypothetical protein
MSNSSMDNVIKKLDASEKRIAENQKQVVIDLKSKELKKVFLGGITLGGNTAFYLISNNLDPLNFAEYDKLNIEVRNLSRNPMGLHISYKGSCNPGDEETLAIALCGMYSPEFEFHKKLKGWVATFTKGNNGIQFIDEFPSGIPNLESHIRDEAQHIGFEIEDIKITTDKNLTYYLITNAKNEANIAEQNNLNVLFKDISNTREIGVLIKYQASFFREDREKVLDALCGEKSITEMIDDKLENWTRRFVDAQGIPKFIENYDTALPELQKELERKAKEDAGLNLSVRTALDRNPIQYIISTISDPSNIADRKNLIIEVVDVQSDRRINLNINYRAGYDPTDEKTVSLAFESSKSIADEIDKRIKGWIHSYISNKINREAGFINQYSKAEVETLSQSIQDQARKICLNLGIQITLDRENELTQFEFGKEKSPLFVPIYVNSYEDELRLHFWLKLAIHESKKVNAVMRSLPSEELKILKLLKLEVADFFRERVSIKEFCYELKSTVRQNLLEHINQFLEYYGRRAEDFFLDSDTYFPSGITIEIGSDKVPESIQIHVNDCDDELELLVHTALELDEDNLEKGAIYSLKNKEDFLRNATRKIIRDFLNAQVTLQDFSSSLKSKVREELFIHLNEIFPKKYGYKVKFLNLDTNLEIPEEIIEVPYIMSCMVDGYPNPIKITNTVQMLIKDLAKSRQMLPNGYVKNNDQGSPLKTWVESKLERIIKPLLLKKKYIDLLVEDKLRDIANSIKQEMRQEARSIGFSVEHIISIPNLEHLYLREDFQIELKQGYLTNDANMQIRLNTLVYLKFETFDKIETYLKPSIDVKQKIEETVSQTIRKQLAKIDPERYYMRFYHADNTLEKESVEELLESEITKRLQELYGATISSVVTRPIDTEIVDLFKLLRGKVPSFDFEITPLKGGESITFQAQFQIDAVGKESWVTFNSRMGSILHDKNPQYKELLRLKEVYERDIKTSDLEDSQALKAIRDKMSELEQEVSGIDRIKESIINSIEQILSYKDPNSIGALENKINEQARKSVKNQYGLEITISNLRRKPTEQEKNLSGAKKSLSMEGIKDMTTALQAAEIKRTAQINAVRSSSNSKTEELKKLQERKSKLDSNDDQEEILQINQQIHALENDLNISSASDPTEILRKIEEDLDSETRTLSEYYNSLEEEASDGKTDE